MVSLSPPAVGRSLEEEAGTPACSPSVKLLSTCRCRLDFDCSRASQFGQWCFCGARLTSGTRTIRNRDRLQHIRDSDTVVFAFWWGAEFKLHINHPAEAKACSPDWCIYKLEHCGKPQPTNCDAHWFCALGFDVLPDENNNYVSLTRLPSVHASHCTCAHK